MRYLFVISLFTAFLLSCTDKKINDNSQATVISDIPQSNGSYVYTGFYFLTNDGQGIKMTKDHSNEVYNISQYPFVSIKNILRATANKNVIDGRDVYGVTIVLDNAGTKDLEQGTDNTSHQYIAIVIANKLLYVVENTSKIKTGILQILLDDYSEKEVNDMIEAINQKK